MSVTASKTYIVETAELLWRTYVVTTPGDEARARLLAAEGDYGAPPDESVELAEERIAFVISR
jgi:hypothetical protein